MNTKICIKCHIEKDLQCFEFRTDTKKIRGACKECIKIYNEQYRNDNKENIIENRKQYYNNNKDKVNKSNKQYNNDNKEEVKEYQKEYYNNNKEAIVVYQKQYRKDRIKKDPEYRLKRIVSNAIYKGLKYNSSSKDGASIWHYLPYSPQELKSHLEKQFLTSGNEWMTWYNHGAYKLNIWNDNNPITWTWHIDHIIPHSFFKYTSMTDLAFQDCWALQNLRPYSAKQNVIDNNRREVV
jgi:hypothetical protein